MDPNACWKRFLDASAGYDIIVALNALHDLSGWLRKGGVAPDNVPPDAVHGLLDIHEHAIEHMGYG